MTLEISLNTLWSIERIMYRSTGLNCSFSIFPFWCIFFKVVEIVYEIFKTGKYFKSSSICAIRVMVHWWYINCESTEPIFWGSFQRFLNSRLMSLDEIHHYPSTQADGKLFTRSRLCLLSFPVLGVVSCFYLDFWLASYKIFPCLKGLCFDFGFGFEISHLNALWVNAWISIHQAHVKVIS